MDFLFLGGINCMDDSPVQTTMTDEFPTPTAAPARNDQPIAFYFAGLIVMLGTMVLCVRFGYVDGLTFVPFALGPLFLALIPMWRYRSRRSQGILLFADIAFLSWFLIYMQVRDAYRNGFDALTVGICSFPVLLGLCMIATWIHRRDSLSPLPAVPSVSVTAPISFYFGIANVIAGTIMLCVHFGFFEGLFSVPISFGPLMLAWIPMWLCCSKRSQGVFMFANFAFACWSLYICVPLLYYRQVSEFDVFGIIALGVYSFPVLLILCVIAMVLHRQDSRLHH
jgi:hypothetical protein